MGQFNRFARAAALASIAACAFAALGATAFAAAKQKPAAAAPAAPLDEAAQKQKDQEAARRSYDAGVKSYSAGKLQPAVDQLSAALRGGGLASTEMARALYVRGIAYKKQSKPGLAISDLTSALWLKNGLNDADRQSATAERAEAYRLAGLGDGNSGTETVAVADPNTIASQSSPPAAALTPAVKPGKSVKTAAAVPAPIPAPIPAQAGGITRQAPDSEAAQDAARARKLASQPVEDGIQMAAVGNVIGSQPVTPATSSVASATAVDPATPMAAPAPQPTTPPSLAALPSESAAPAPATSTPGSSVAGFFSNLFGGGGSSSSTAPASVTTASTTPPQSASSSWSGGASVADGAGKPNNPAKAVQTAAATPAAAPAPAAATAPAVKSGKYKVHIAAVRSRAEAEAMAQQVAKQHGAVLNSRVPQVDEAVIGSMGTFYRVRVSGYATEVESRAVCNTLRTSGFDCLVVTN